MTRSSTAAPASEPSKGRGRRGVPRSIRTLLALLVMVASICLLLYPFVSEYLFQNRVDSVVSTYDAEVANLDDSVRTALWRAAVDYNASLAEGDVLLTDPFDPDVLREKNAIYQATLSLDGSPVMAFIEIPKIDVYLPIYHGTDATTLQTGIGHLEGSSLPVGGTDTHVVISGHTGLQNAKLFTDLVELEVGDHFYFHTLGQTLAYEVDQILVVDPNDTTALRIVRGQDYASLVTCTPYGVNSHRLLVRGHRVELEEADPVAVALAETVDGFSSWMREYMTALVVGVVGVVAIWIVAAVVLGRRKRERKREAERVLEGAAAPRGESVAEEAAAPEAGVALGAERVLGADSALEAEPEPVVAPASEAAPAPAPAAASVWAEDLARAIEATWGIEDEARRRPVRPPERGSVSPLGQPPVRPPERGSGSGREGARP